MPIWSWSSKLVIKCTKYNANFIPLDKIPKLWFINQFIVFSLYLHREIKKKHFFSTIDVGLWSSQRFPETLINNSYWLLWLPSEQSPVQSSQRNARIRWEIYAKIYMHLFKHLCFLTTRQKRVKWHRKYLSVMF